jgi:hypothetical protein
MMSPTATAVLILLALVVDYMSIGPNSIRDRLAFFLALPAIRVGFRNSPLTHWTVDMLAAWINTAKDTTKGAYIAQASANMIIGAGVGILAIYCVGVLLPVSASSRLGAFARLSFSSHGGGGLPNGTGGISRLNARLWFCAATLGLLADLPGGLIGTILRSVIDALTSVVAAVPNLLFGVS